MTDTYETTTSAAADQMDDGMPAGFAPPEDAPDFDSDPLADLDAAIDAAPEPDVNNYDDLPNGKFVVYVRKATKNVTKTGIQILNLQLQVMRGPWKGFIQGHSFFLDPSKPERLGWVKKDLGRIGIDLSKVRMSSLLTDQIEMLLDRVLEIEVKRKPKTQNVNEGEKDYFLSVYFNRYMPGEEIPADVREMTRAACEPAAATDGGFAAPSAAQKPAATGGLGF